MNLNDHRKRLNRNRKREASYEMGNISFIRLVSIIGVVISSYWKGRLAYNPKPYVSDTPTEIDPVKSKAEKTGLHWIRKN